MLSNILLYFCFLPLIMLKQILSLVTFIIPSEWQVAVTQLFSYINYFQGYLPLYPNPNQTGLNATIGIITIFNWTLTIYLATLLLRLIVFIASKLPFLNVHGSTTELIRKK